MFEEAVAHIFRGFTDIVSGLHMSAVHTPSFLDIFKYLFVFLVGPMTAVIAYDQFFPIFEGVNLYLVIVICTLILLVTPALLFGFFRYFGGHWLLNWHMKKTSRYLDFCRMPREYIASLLPKDTWKWQYRLVGSSADHGFGFFPLLNLNSGILPWSNPIIVQDVDVNVFYKPLHISMDQLIPTMPGYCQVVIDGFIEDAFLKDCIVKGGKQSFLSGRLVSQKIGTEFLDGNIEFNYPAITFKTILDGPRGKFRFDCDVVFAVKNSMTLLQYFTIGAGEWRTLSHCSCLTESELGDAMWFTSIVQGITYAMTLIGELHLHRLSLNSLSIILTRQP